MAAADDDTGLDMHKLRLEIRDLELRVEKHLRRDNSEVEALLADIRLKNRQSSTEIWKVVLATAVATAVFGGFLLTLATYIATQLQ